MYSFLNVSFTCIWPFLQHGIATFSEVQITWEHGFEISPNEWKIEKLIKVLDIKCSLLYCEVHSMIVYEHVFECWADECENSILVSLSVAAQCSSDIQVQNTFLSGEGL